MKNQYKNRSIKSITVTLLLIIIHSYAFSQTPFAKGYELGYKNGYCYEDITCISPVPPIAPIPATSESPESYMDGYNRGFVKGKNDKDDNIKRNTQHYQTSTTQSNTTNNDVTNNTNQGYQTATSSNIDYTYKSPTLENPNLYVQSYKNTMDKAFREYQNKNYNSSLNDCIFLVNHNMGTDEVYLLMGMDYFELSDMDSAKKYLKKSAKMGNQDARTVLKQSFQISE